MQLIIQNTQPIFNDFNLARKWLRSPVDNTARGWSAGGFNKSGEGPRKEGNHNDDWKDELDEEGGPGAVRDGRRGGNGVRADG